MISLYCIILWGTLEGGNILTDGVAHGHTKGIKALSLSVGCNWSELKSTVTVFCLSAARKQTLIS